MQQRRCFEQATTFETPLEEEASRLRARAVGMPPGHEREIVLRMLREIEIQLDQLARASAAVLEDGRTEYRQILVF
jgi:hypothetical protein